MRKPLRRVCIFSEPLDSADSVAADNTDYKQRYTEHHNNALNKIRARLNEISSEQQQNGCEHSYNYHAYFVVYTEQNLRNRGKTLID